MLALRAGCGPVVCGVGSAPRACAPVTAPRAGTRPWHSSRVGTGRVQWSGRVRGRGGIRAACADCLELRCVIRAAREDCSELLCEYEAVTAMRVPRGACASSRFSPHAGRLTGSLSLLTGPFPRGVERGRGRPRSTQKAHALARRPSLRLAGSHSTQRLRVATIPATASSADAQDDDVSAPGPPLRG